MSSKKYSKSKLASFKKSIEGKLNNVANELDDIKDNLDTNTRGTASLSQDAVYSVHMADAGTDSFEREKGFHFMNRETDYHKLLMKALERIKDETFGICKICKELIVEERMLEVPNATKCVKCKENEKLNI
ncbi:TraR/DksA C4-type zinc finger protein [Candidatus Marinimicrobia bacterium]|jgi:RNA polymerase-binding transcription factor DksA|nr:TraR/DksA C4-type zinc finger protein [Candidatus Neomarinimicrobiota bacterium]MDC0384086.1 TraR/DksA C4-type zinc finger protein [Candidatus Neomarinimicrobiota bacterium]MDC0630948.1 TraR/DksA C4-type zinc finger protein [Candidatus Neomarinimicrobiota bacterium]MDC0630955.1 TraR/DksA C4-type zinc finger protein [Candidatus Neomarinimicrobiota bacterium]